MKKVITYGTYDLLHVGHVNLLKRARALGDHLTVALSTDEFNTLQKSKHTYYSYSEREAILRSIRYVDEVIPESSWDQKADDIKRLGIDVLVMGDDWTGKFDHLSPYCEVIYLPRTPDISTTRIKSDLGNRSCYFGTRRQPLIPINHKKRAFV